MSASDLTPADSPSPIEPIEPDEQIEPIRPILIGTAGHIDHGKTRLVGRLTGIMTDRLPELGRASCGERVVVRVGAVS